MPLLAPLLLLTSLACAADSAPRTWQADFSTTPVDAPAGWEPDSSGWEVASGAYLGDSGTSLWRAVPLGAAITFACDVTVLEQLRGDWLVASVALAADDKNYWALNLVAAPETKQRRHSAEMSESLAGHWQADTAPPSPLPRLPGKGGQLNWQLGKTYRLEIQLRPEDVVGRVLDGNAEVSRFGVRLSPGVPAVRAGRPLLRASGLRVRFSNASVTVAQTAPEPVVSKPAPPAWVSRPGVPVAKATGFFRAVFIENGKELAPTESARLADHSAAQWWLVDPEGKPFFDVGTDHVNYRAHWCEALGYAPYHRNVAAKFGSEEAWAASAVTRLKQWGFNTLPAGHSPSVRHRGLPHILFASFGSSFARREWICEPIHWTGFPDVFSPKWPAHCRIVARKLTQEGRGDPWCLGTFLDNELEWYGKKGHLVDEVFKLGPQQAAKKALAAWLLARYGSVAELNRRLGTNYTEGVRHRLPETSNSAATKKVPDPVFADTVVGFSSFLNSTEVPKSSPALDEVRSAFLAQIAERYFSVACQALRQFDPDHMVLGCRFAGRAPEPALASAGKYNDLFTFNTYPRVDFQDVWRPDGTGGVVQRVPRELAEMYRVVRRPMIITEWSFPALDSGLPCKHGAGMRVATQDQKAACYRIFANAMCDLPFMVGYHYFMWADEPALGISSTFPEDSNYGLVNEKDETYTVLVDTATEVNRSAAARHAKSLFSGQSELKASTAAIELVNPDAVPSRCRWRIAGGGVNVVGEATLAPNASRRIPVDAKGPWWAELQSWDGTKTRAIGGRPLGRLEVANASMAPLADAPVVLDGPPVAAALLHLKPGETTTLPAPTAPFKDAQRLELYSDGTTWSCDRRDGSLFDTVRAGDLPLGRLAFAVHAQADGRDFWTAANQVVSLRSQDQRDATVVEATVAYSTPGTTGSPRYRAGLRAVVFKRGGLALVKPLWIESTDSRPWRLVDAFWFCRPAIGGSTENDEIGGPQVPNYYGGAAQFFTDAKLGGCFGAINQPSGWRVQFWKDKDPRGQFHPDAHWTIDRPMAPGSRWAADGVAYLWVFGHRDANGWEATVAKNSQAAKALLDGTR